MIFFCIFANIKFNINKFKSNTSMKKLFALAIVAGMVFVSCGSKTEEVPEEVGAEEVEVVTQDEQDQQAAEMPVEQDAAAEAAQ